MVFRRFKVREFHRGLLYKKGEFQRVLQPGDHTFLGQFGLEVESVPVLQTRFLHWDLEVIAKSGALGDEAQVLELKSNERALVWVEGRFLGILGPGLHVLWKIYQSVETEVVDINTVMFQHPRLPQIVRADGAAAELNVEYVEQNQAGLLYINGRFSGILEPGMHVFWKHAARISVLCEDLREQTFEVPGQEIMTSDRVTLRMTANVTYRVVDPIRLHNTVRFAQHELYRTAQLAVRAIVGTKTLDSILAEKDEVQNELAEIVRTRGAAIGVETLYVGIRDIILPGEMKTLLNKVMEAKQTAEAALITRREETAAMRSQANTAKILENNPVLMRLRELETLERVAEKGELRIVLGEKGLAERLTTMV